LSSFHLLRSIFCPPVCSPPPLPKHKASPFPPSFGVPLPGAGPCLVFLIQAICPTWRAFLSPSGYKSKQVPSCSFARLRLPTDVYAPHRKSNGFPLDFVLCLISKRKCPRQKPFLALMSFINFLVCHFSGRQSPQLSVISGPFLLCMLDARSQNLEDGVLCRRSFSPKPFLGRLLPPQGCTAAIPTSWLFLY